MVSSYFNFSNDYGITLPSVGTQVREEGYFFRRFRGLVYPWNKENSSIIGRGGSGVIHIVRDEIMDRIVALKLPNESILDEPQVRSEVLNEASQALELTHPNIVRIFDFHDQDGRWGISMQFVRGKSLDKWREKLAPYQMSGTALFDVEQIKPWILQLCDALSYAHEEVGIVHCDIKPPNLLLERWFDTRLRHIRERLLLTDFGITQKLRDFTTRTQRHRTGSRTSGGGSGSEDGGAAGTLAYMSPQQLAGKEGAVSDDIYAIGMTIYELLTGKPAFYQGDAKVVQHQIESVVPPSMMERRRQRSVMSANPIPDLWEQVTAQCLHKDPEKRPSSVRELARLLGLTTGLAAGLSLEEQSRLQKEADGLKNQVEDQEVKIVTLNHRLSELESAASGKVEEAALLEAREQLIELRASCNLRESELREYDEKLQDIEEENLKLQQRLAEMEQAGMEAVSSGAAERQDLLARLQQAQEQLQVLQQERDNVLLKLQKNEAGIAALQDQLANETRQTAEAINLSKTAEMRVKQAQEKVEETKRTLLAARDEAVEKTRQSVAAELAKAKQAAEEALEKASKTAAQAEKANSKLKELSEQTTAPLRPILLALLAVIVVGLILGAAVGVFTGGKGATELVEVNRVAEELYAKAGKGAVLVTKRHVQVWLRQIHLDDKELGTAFSALDADAPATGMSYLEAAAFCDWLTLVACPDPSKEWFDLPQLKELPAPGSSGGQLAREWTRDESSGGGPSARKMLIFPAGQNASLPRTQKAPDIGFHIVLRRS
jgi:serine/threonine protein kinase